MNKITLPLKSGMRGDAVTNSQDGLLLLLEKNPALFVLPHPPTHVPEPLEWPKVIESLHVEHKKMYYGKITPWLINNFQNANDFEPSVTVDEVTAQRLNRLLDELNGPEESSTYTVKGTVRLVDGDTTI